MPMGPRQGERGNPAGRGSKGTVSEDGVEQEYIANLQKQVYFLELESKLLREKVNEKPPDGLDLPGPLDDHLLKLKQKYASLEAKLLAEKEELMEGMHRMKMQLDEAERVRKQLQSEVAEQSHFRKLAEQTLADDEENDRREFTELRQKIAIGKEEQRMLKAEMEGMRQKILQARTDRDQQFVDLEARVKSAEDAKAEAESQQKRLTEDMTNMKLEHQTTFEAYTYLQEEEEMRKAELKNLLDGHDKLQLEVRQLTAERDHAKVAIAKLEGDHRKVAEEAIANAKKAVDLGKQLKAMQGEIASNSEARKVLVGEAVELREKMIKAQSEREKAVLDMQRLNQEIEGMKQEMSMMMHDKRLWKEEQAEEQAMKVGLDKDTMLMKVEVEKLRNEVAMLTEKLEKRDALLETFKTDLGKTKAENARLEAELFNARERLSIAQELEQIDLGQFSSMRETNLEVAKKIERFLDATKDKMQQPSRGSL